jgi:hypothetical protein
MLPPPQMKDRLARLIGRLDDESLMATALQLNDDAQVGGWEWGGGNVGVLMVVVVGVPETILL